MNTFALVSEEFQDDVIRCHACGADLASDPHDASPGAPERVDAPILERSRSATGITIAAVVLAIGVGFLIPILCSLFAIGIGVVALCSSNGKGSAVKRLAIASVVLGIVGVLGTIAVLSGA